MGGRKGIRPVKKQEWWGAGVVICLERGADLHMAQLMPLLLTVSCFSKIQIGFTFLVTAHLGGPGKGAVKRTCTYTDQKSGLFQYNFNTNSQFHGRCRPKFSFFRILQDRGNKQTRLDFTEARDSEWQWHQLGHMQVCTSLQTDNHASTSPLSFFYRPDALPAAQPTASKQ